MTRPLITRERIGQNLDYWPRTKYMRAQVAPQSFGMTMVKPNGAIVCCAPNGNMGAIHYKMGEGPIVKWGVISERYQNLSHSNIYAGYNGWFDDIVTAFKKFLQAIFKGGGQPDQDATQTITPVAIIDPGHDMTAEREDKLREEMFHKQYEEEREAYYQKIAPATGPIFASYEQWLIAKKAKGLVGSSSNSVVLPLMDIALMNAEKAEWAEFQAKGWERLARAVDRPRSPLDGFIWKAIGGQQKGLPLWGLWNERANRPATLNETMLATANMAGYGAVNPFKLRNWSDYFGRVQDKPFSPYYARLMKRNM